MNMARRFFIYHLPVILYAAAIILVSSLRKLPDPGIQLTGLDKIAHILEYALFAALAFRSFSHLSGSIGPKTAVYLSLVFVISFAALDEYFQHFIPGRSSDPADILADTGGAAFVLAYLWYRQKRKRLESAT